MGCGLETRPGEGLYLPIHRGRQIGRALVALAFVLSLGTAGFVVIEGWDPLQALYFTLITITTVGYGDEGISQDGRYFALLLLMGGIGVASWSLGTMVQGALSNELNWKARMNKLVKGMNGHTIICGFGVLGRTVACELQQEGCDVVVVETEPENLRRAVERGLPVIEGHPSDDDVLRQAGIDRAAHLVTVVDDQVENIVVALSARGLRSDLPIVARRPINGDAARKPR